MKKKKSMKRIISYSFILVAVLLAVFMFYKKKEEVFAKHTLPGIETIATNTGYYDPYIILEVVEDKADASLGYLIGGEEPIYNGKAVKDYTTQAERDAEFPVNLLPAGYASLEGTALTTDPFITTGAKTVDIRGSYVSASPGYYSLEETDPVYIEYEEAYAGEQRYDMYAVFIDDGTSMTSYSPTFTKIVNVLPSVTIEAITYENYSKYEIDNTYANIELNATLDLSVYDGTTIYDVVGTEYRYKGKIVAQDVSGEPKAYVLCADGKKYLFEDSSLYAGYELISDPLGTKYEIISFSFNAAAGEYYISNFDAAEPKSTDYSFEEGYMPSDEGGYVMGTEGTSTYVFKADASGDLNWESDYSQGVYKTYSYDGGFTNNEWLKKYVFDREEAEIDDLVIDVKTVTMEEFNDYNLDYVDMVYFAGTDSNIDAGYIEDIESAQAAELVGKVVDDHVPVLMNRSAYELIQAVNHAYPDKFPNMYKLSVLLTQIGYSGIDTTNLISNWGEPSYFATLAATTYVQDATYGFNYVNESFYMYDDTDYGTGAVPFVNADFLDAFSEEMVEHAFQMVIDEIKSENFYIQIAGYSDKMPVEVTKANAMRYIINYGYKRNVIKSNISVLEIEPCYSFKYSDSQLSEVTTLNEAADNETGTWRKTFKNVVIDRNLLSRAYIANNWATQFIDNEGNIELTQTYTGEFIGKIEDLNETYDLIYIGLDTSTMNTELNISNGVYYKSDYTLYNNNSLNGLIYTHSGDYLTMTNSYVLRGLLNPNDVSQENDMDGYGKYALSGNDITLEKFNALCEYMDAGYPIVFADGFYNLDTSGMATSVNTSKIDHASYMYRVAKYALDEGYFGANVNVDSNITNDTTGSEAKSTLAKHLNISKLSIELTTVPTIYDGTVADPAYLTKTGGTYTLEYQFRLKDDSAVMDGTTNYDAQLYIDSSVDGRFYADEEIVGLKIYELDDGTFVQVYQNNGRFELEAGKYYKLVREVPTGYVGVLPWKLVLSRNDNELVRKSVTGYTAIASSTTNRETIKVLQLLASSDYVSNNWNLETNSNFGALLDEVQDFEIQIKAVPVEDYIASGSVSDIALHYDYLDDYNMIVIGFSDGYSFSAKSIYPESKRENLQANAALAIRQYISEGRSVLFTHDTTSYCNTTDFHDSVRCDGSYNSEDPNGGAWLWGYDFNRYVRDIVGMDRYGVLQKIDGLSPVDTIYDTMWTANNSQLANVTYPYTQGYSDQTVVQYASANDYVYTTRPEVAGKDGQYGGKMYVTKTNEGQITRYPFDIPESFRVTNTHRQYYQLNLDTDSKDDIKDDDIVVWYCISDVKNDDGTEMVDIYETCPNDVRNNYYIYNKGNVTYSGVGHSEVLAERETEMKLFVNTMVAAYNAGVHPPKVTYKESGEEDAIDIEYLYLPYDEGLGAYIDTTAEIYFDIADTSFAQGTKTITAEYYLEVTTANANTITVTIDGETKYLQEFSPTEITNVRTGEVHKGNEVNNIDNDSKYHFTLNPEQMSLLNSNRANVYVGAKTTYTRASGSGSVEVSETAYGYYKISILKAQLFEMK